MTTEDRAEAVALADLIRSRYPQMSPSLLADSILASDWFASIVAARVEEARAEALAPIHALILDLNADADYLVPKRHLGDRLRAALASPDTTGKATS